MDDDRVRATGERAVAAVLLGIGLASFGVLAWVVARAASLERSLDFGDIVVSGVFAAFAAFCAYLGFRLLSYRSDRSNYGLPAARATEEKASPARVRRSQACAAAGVVCLMLSVLLPADWHPAVLLFLGIALLAVSHALTPCVEKMAQLRRARASMHQL